jgi:hypothetical protein
MSKAVVIPKSWVEKLGKGNHTNGAALLDGFTAYNGEPIDWHEGSEGDYVLRQEDVKALGKGSHNRGFRLLS